MTIIRRIWPGNHESNFTIKITHSLIVPLIASCQLITLFLLYIFAGCSHEKSIRSKSWKVRIWYFGYLDILDILKNIIMLFGMSFRRWSYCRFCWTICPSMSKSGTSIYRNQGIIWQLFLCNVLITQDTELTNVHKIDSLSFISNQSLQKFFLGVFINSSLMRWLSSLDKIL